jgi:serine/threonine protein kinase
MVDPPVTERHDIEKLADDFMANYRAGRCPSVDQYVVQYPGLAHELRPLLVALVLLEQNRSLPADGAAAANGGGIVAGGLRQIGDFVIVREIGRGGMGIVYEAVQQSLCRHVALKVLSLPGLLQPSHLERFRREARAAARLQHSHIVPVFDFGTHNERYYYAMQYVAGQSLDSVIRSLRDAPLRTTQAAGSRDLTKMSPSPESGEQEGSKEATPALVAIRSDTSSTSLSDTELTTSVGRRAYYRQVGRIALQAAEALEYAHSEGVLHRDIKPSNLLLDSKGNTWITDFGLAKIEGADELTQAGDFVGTLRYMAPERLAGTSDRRGDIYGLGATIYELLTLRPFLDHRSRSELLRRIVDESPTAPRRIEPSIPIDLETIVLKAIAKEPSARYDQASQMAEDLRRLLADRPILARRATPVEHLVRWCRRNRMIAALGAAVAVLLVTAGSIMAISNAHVRRESLAKEKAQREQRSAQGNAWEIYAAYAPHKSEEDVLSDFDKAVKSDPDSAENLWLRGFEYGFLNRWDEALADMTKARPLLKGSKLISSADRDWFVAMAYLAKGDRAGYQVACREALAKIPEESRLRECGTLLWLCTVTPNAVDEPQRLADYVEAVLPPAQISPACEQLLDVGAALYRAGKYSDAQERLQEVLNQIAGGKAPRFSMTQIFAHVFLAMTDARLGAIDEAKSNLSTADRLSATIKPACWVEQLEQMLLTEEAQRTIDASRAGEVSSE